MARSVSIKMGPIQFLADSTMEWKGMWWKLLGWRPTEKWIKSEKMTWEWFVDYFSFCCVELYVIGYLFQKTCDVPLCNWSLDDREIGIFLLLLIVISDGKLGKDASTTNFEEKRLTKMHKKANFVWVKYLFYFFFGLDINV